MGKGDKKSRKGKITIGSYGKRRARRMQTLKIRKVTEEPGDAK